MNKYLILAGASLVACIGAYTVGYNKGKNISATEILAYENTIKSKEAELAKALANVDVKYVTEYVQKVEYIDRVKTKIVTEYVPQVPEQYELSVGWVNTYNGSITNSIGFDPSDPRPSGSTDREVLATIVENNGQCLADRANLEALQDLVKAREEEIARINSK